MIDFSFMPSLKCNLKCSFCMYDCDNTKKEILDYNKTKEFVDTFDWSQINSIGFYGGEISINMDLYQKFIDLVPKEINIWCITNGSWSVNTQWTNRFYNYVLHNKLYYTMISNTPEHRKFQNRKVIKEIVHKNKFFKLKEDDTLKPMYPMGRLYKLNWTCTYRCKKATFPDRYALMPNGNIIFQSCDGVYPIISTYHQPFTDLNKRCIKNE